MEEHSPVAVLVIGTSHISAKSARAIRDAARRLDPTIVAVELDRGRLRALQERASGKRDHRLPLSLVRDVGVTGYLFLALGASLQRRLAGIVDVEPGVDMLAAVDLARERGAQLALVDQDVAVTMRRLSAAFTWREKVRVLGDIVLSPFRRERIAIRLDDVPSAQTIRTVMALLRERYPSLHKVLVEERNEAMARNVAALARRNPGARILLTVGAGHEEEIVGLLRKTRGIDVIERA